MAAAAPLYAAVRISPRRWTVAELRYPILPANVVYDAAWGETYTEEGHAVAVAAEKNRLAAELAAERNDAS